MLAREPIILLMPVAPAHGRGLKLPGRNANRTRENQDESGTEAPPFDGTAMPRLGTGTRTRIGTWRDTLHGHACS